MRNRTKTIDQLLMMDLGLEKDVHKDDRPKKTGITQLIKEIDQPNREANPNQDKVSNINKMQTKFSMSPIRNYELTLEVRISKKVMKSYTTPKGWGVTLELQTGDILIKHGERNQEQRRWTNDIKRIKAIYLGLFRYRQIFRGLEENSQAISITENTNTDSIYSENLKLDNRHTKQVEYPGRLFSKERNIHSPVLSVVDNTNTGFVRNRGKQTRGQI
ncbi:MAG: hypothetical protein EZS28_022176, partial [Streblomastix strix]